MGTLTNDLMVLLNSYSAENRSNTPDFILAQYLERCLWAFDAAVQKREAWYGRGQEVGAILEKSVDIEPLTPLPSPTHSS